jgi:uncharacterized membrane protein YbaN (DUF454 family)
MSSAGKNYPPSSAVLPRGHGSPIVRALFFVAGAVSLALAVAGVVLPVLPTTPLVLLAAACFARSYRPFHEWLIAHRLFGPMVREWHEHRSIPYRVKLTAISMMALGLGASIVFFIQAPWLQALLAVFGVGLGTWMYRLPSRDR